MIGSLIPAVMIGQTPALGVVEILFILVLAVFLIATCRE